jgi:hypothetical protein
MRLCDLFENGVTLQKTVWSRKNGSLTRREVTTVSMEPRRWIEVKPDEAANATNE